MTVTRLAQGATVEFKRTSVAPTARASRAEGGLAEEEAEEPQWTYNSNPLHAAKQWAPVKQGGEGAGGGGEVEMQDVGLA